MAGWCSGRRDLGRLRGRLRDSRLRSCAGPELESGFEKIAVYALASGAPTHAARQLPSGAWLSKLGDLQDIEHQTLEALEGRDYGKAVRFLRRPRQEK
ncbi:MAG TPA: hypothetical protein VGY66_29240 [Gemmataceae bacterium]|nr:hypothetical protein [Gemmataceae bacterium]